MDHHFMMWSIVESVTHTQQEMEQGDHTNSVISSTNSDHSVV